MQPSLLFCLLEELATRQFEELFRFEEFRFLGVSQTPVAVSLKLHGMCQALPRVLLQCPLIWHEAKRKHPHPLLLGETGNIQHTDNYFQRNPLTFSYIAWVGCRAKPSQCGANASQDPSHDLLAWAARVI